MSLPTFETPPLVACEQPNHGTFGYFFNSPDAITKWLGLAVPKLADGSVPWHIYWATCRETFHGHYEVYDKNGWNKFLYSYGIQADYGVDYALPILDLLNWMEKRLGTEPVKVSLNKNWRQIDMNGRSSQMKRLDCLQFEMTDFWLLNPMRFEFFTAMLKTGMLNHKVGADPWTAINASKYFKDTINATKAFLNGKHWFDMPEKYAIGWYNNMYGHDDKKLREPTENDVRLRAFFLSEKHGGEQWYKAEMDLAPKAKAA